MQKTYDYRIYPRHSIITTDKRFVNNGNGSMGRSHWTFFYVEDNKCSYFDSFGGQLAKCLPNQLLKPKNFLKNKIQDITSRLCVVYFLYFFYIMERMDFHEVVLKIHFGS